MPQKGRKTNHNTNRFSVKNNIVILAAIIETIETLKINTIKMFSKKLVNPIKRMSINGVMTNVIKTVQRLVGIKNQNSNNIKPVIKNRFIMLMSALKMAIRTIEIDIVSPILNLKELLKVKESLTLLAILLIMFALITRQHKETIMPESTPQTVIAIYRVRADKEDEFLALMRKHHPTLHRLGLVTDEQPIVYRGAEKSGGAPIVFEIFTWKSEQASDTAHELAEVMQIWEAMGTMVEERDGRPKFEFPHVRRLDLAFEKA